MAKFVSRDIAADLMGINSKQEKKTPAPKKAKKEPAKLEPGKENRTRRVQLVMTPSLYAQLKTKAHREETSINDYVNKVLENTIKEK